MLDPCLGQAEDVGLCSKAPSRAPKQGSCSASGAAAIPCPFPPEQALLQKWHSELCLRGVFWEGKELCGFDLYPAHHVQEA